ncbi:STAS domain-containing protein [Aestuariibacter salexigens]|uniref:STAS domain-containing protein n=1 Tax=Aestuariibacter salexigens TaxID=226010 RepID=UPI000413EAE7|nr:STAS domain-containing protein [Aestuariibacter salexigens]
MQHNLQTQTKNNILVIQLPEEFDCFKVDKAREQLDHFANDVADNIQINFLHTQFLDSSGIGAIVFLFKRLRAQNRHLELVNVAGQPLKLMSMLHVDRAIPVNRVSMNNVA